MRAAARLAPLGIPLAGLGLVTAEILYAAHRRLPCFPDLDPSGVFGEPHLPPLRVVALGDSSVTGPGLEQADAIWVRQVARRLSRHHRVELVSLARGGARARDVLAGQLPPALRLEPGLALLSVGANDALRGTPLRSLGRSLEGILGRLDQWAIPVVLLGVGDLGTIPRLPPPLDVLASLRARRVDRLQERLVEKYPRAAKGAAWSEETCRAFRTRPELFASDLFHASSAGHRVWAELAMPAVEAVLAAR